VAKLNNVWHTTSVNSIMTKLDVND